MESLSMLSSLHDEVKSENCLEPHYKECYRIAIDELLEGGIDSYKDFLQKERTTEFLAEDELTYIINHIQKPPESLDNSQGDVTDDNSSSGTYWPLESDVEAPNLDLGWPYVAPSQVGTTDISLYFHPPRGHPFTIKEMVRRMIKEARQVIAIVMDMFTDIDILRELVEASSRGVPVYLLLDDINFPHFLKMTEKQGIQVQRLRNLRIRTVKGQDYFSKSGAKFSGKMDQKFLLVDCEKVMYGTYSFMWSYEKIHLSMVQIITGKLVESFDEEFRTIYARSCIPGAFGSEELVSGKLKKIPWENGTYQYSRSSLLSASSQRSLFGRKEQIHALDSTYLKPRTRFMNNEDDKFGMRNASYRPHQLGFNVQNKIQHFQQFERHDNWKRHSYAAGDKTEMSPYMMLNRAMNNRVNNAPATWNRQVDVASIGSSSRGGYSSNYNGSTQSFATRLTPRIVPNLSERSVRRSFHGADNHIRSLQQRMPTLERTTKSFLRNWRIESYLNDYSDIPPDSNDTFSERNEVAEGTESITDNSLYSNSRLRSSFLYKATLPEQREANSTTGSSHSNSTIVDSQGSLTPIASSPSPHNMRFSDTMDQNNFTNYDNQHTTPQDTFKRHSLQVPENSGLGSNYTSHLGQTSYLYTALCTNNQTEPTKTQNDTLFKRRSLPLFEHRKVNGGQNNTIVPPNYIYNSLVRRKPENILHQNTLNFTSTPNLENAVQHTDENTNSKSQSSLVTQATSTESLDATSQEDHNAHSPTKKGSPNFLKKGSQKLKSLLNLAPEKKENISKNKTPAFYRMCSSSDTLISEGDEHGSPKKSDTKNDVSLKKEKLRLSASQFSLNKSKESICTAPPKSPTPISEETDQVTQTPEMIITEKTGDASAPRFNTEQIQYQDTRTYATYGRVMPPQRDLTWNTQTEVLPQHNEMPTMMQREMHLRHSQHRGMQQIDMQQRDMFTQHKPQEEVNPARVNERRVYSRFEPFCKLENTMPVHNSNLQISDYHNKGVMNTYNRPNNILSYNSSVYNPIQPPENKFGRFMQKFGSFIHKKQ
ncbi:hypothetical protein XENTR_v10014287 [Xenopus tropicalis]|uniref:Family with sequence similarity 83 member B n=1 Tax=Xenopus tropicalis TaxID=8364 RepID=F6RCU0_XENTR|nr:protein FAM83B [Xenopus tropicalis]KAE8603292.1 hypothetical protein XENTR_v10014287 [Xenopus tropicalis]|eukprot:XP_002934897.1 PREDICTED: protein FAM83B [Xenopus tropicalis]